MRAEWPGGNSVRTMAGLTDSQVAQYREQGWLAPIDVLTADEAADAPADLEAAEADFPDDVHAGGPLHPPHRQRRLRRHPVRGRLGPAPALTPGS